MHSHPDIPLTPPSPISNHITSHKQFTEKTSPQNGYNAIYILTSHHYATTTCTSQNKVTKNNISTFYLYSFLLFPLISTFHQQMCYNTRCKCTRLDSITCSTRNSREHADLCKHPSKLR